MRAYQKPGRAPCAVNGCGKPLYARTYCTMHFENLGAGEHPCHWCGVVLPWQGRPSQQINADHLDGVRTNDVPENLVPACLRCNTQRVRRQAVSA